MKELMLNVIRRLTEIFYEKTNIVILLLIVNIFFIAYVYVELLDAQYHYYMNTTASLEQINNVKIDKYDGKFERELSTEEQLIRKNNRKLRLYYIIKSFKK